MKKSYLHREWARVLDMCEGTDILPIDCLKINGQTGRHPDFKNSPNVYEFALAILEGKPVFVGDQVWLKNARRYITMSREIIPSTINDSCCSWGEPKETFMLNGVELPRPDTEDGYMFLLSSTTQKKKYYFSSLQDRNKFADAVIELIEDALK